MGLGEGGVAGRGGGGSGGRGSAGQVLHLSGWRSRDQQRQVPAAQGSCRSASDTVHPWSGGRSCCAVVSTGAELVQVQFLDSGRCPCWSLTWSSIPWRHAGVGVWRGQEAVCSFLQAGGRSSSHR